MSDFSGIGNCIMLLGLSMLLFNILWSFIFGMMHTLMSLTGRPRTGIAAVFLAVWGYFLSSQTQSIYLKAQEVHAMPPAAYISACAIVLAVYIVADRMGAVWVAERKLDAKLVAVVHRIHPLAALIFVYALIAMLFWPAKGHINLVLWFVNTLQNLLDLQFFGLLSGVAGIFYIFRMIRRIIRFIRIGPKGLPPFPESMRK